MSPEIRDVSDRKFSLITQRNLAEAPSCIPSDCEHFSLFLAIDAREFSDAAISKLAKSLLDRGLVHLDAWGREFERVHDLFDLQRDPSETDETVVMTSWHTDESLEESLWEFVYLGYVTGTLATKHEWITISQTDSSWNRELEATLRATTLEACGAALSVREW